MKGICRKIETLEKDQKTGTKQNKLAIYTNEPLHNIAHFDSKEVEVVYPVDGAIPDPIALCSTLQAVRDALESLVTTLNVVLGNSPPIPSPFPDFVVGSALIEQGEDADAQNQIHQA